MKTDKNKLRESKLAWVVAVVVSLYAGAFVITSVIESQIEWIVIPTQIVVVMSIIIFIGFVVAKLFD